MADRLQNSSPAMDAIIRDDSIRAQKTKLMRRLRWNTVLNSVSKVATFIGAPLLAGGLGVGLKSIIENWSSLNGVTAALSVVSMPVIGTLAAGALFVAMAVGADYMASRIWQANQFDNLEVNAQSTAHHLVQELKANDLCLTKEHAGQCRSDGKTWAQVVEAQKQSRPGQSLQ